MAALQFLSVIKSQYLFSTGSTMAQLEHLFSSGFLLDVKVSNGAKIRNRYNQVPHLTQDTNGKVTNSQKTPQTRAKRSYTCKPSSMFHHIPVMIHCISSEASMRA